MGLLSLTKDGVSFLLDENDITRVYSLDGVVKVEYLKANGGTLDTIIVEESLATIDAASDELIELTSNGVAFLLNYTIIRQVLTEGSGSKVIYEKLQTQSVVVEETPTEINALINAPSTEPLRYKALLSQNAPVATTTDPTMIAGQIWTLEAYNAADAATIAALELVSGTLYAVGSKYRSATGQTLNVNAATTFSYDGSPYVVSTDANGDFNPFLNTLGGNPVWSYGGVGEYYLTLSGMWIIGKVFITIPPINGVSGGGSKCFVDTINDITLFSFKGGSNFDGLFSYYPFEIEVYP